MDSLRIAFVIWGLFSVIFGLGWTQSDNQPKDEADVSKTAVLSNDDETPKNVLTQIAAMSNKIGESDEASNAPISPDAEALMNADVGSFQPLFKSVLKNKNIKIKEYSDTLKDEHKRYGQVYNTMMEEMHTAKLKRVIKTSNATQNVIKRSNAYNDKGQHFIDAMLKTRTSKLMHSTPVSHDYESVQVKVLPALTDNYMYLLIDKKSREAAIVDSVDTKLALRAAKAANVTITTILTTHHHADHAGGNVELVKKLNNSALRVVGGSERIPALTVNVSHNDEFSFGSMTIKCLHTPGHTSDHFCYYVTSPTAKHPLVFTGDTLFAAGCGRFLEGTAKQMDVSLNIMLASLPDDTRVYCGHEYTRRNLEFAEEVEPRNERTKIKLFNVLRNRSAKLPTMPTTIAEEKDTNPFMRLDMEEVKRFAQNTNRTEIMQILRNSKDKF